MSDRPSFLQFEQGPDDSDDIGATVVDVTRKTRVSMSTTQLWRLMGLVAAFVLSIAAILPNLLPKKWTIATQTYVDESTGAVLKAVEADRETDKRQDGEIKYITVSIEEFADQQRKTRASAEATRVTQHIRNSDRRLAAYQRIYAACLRNLKAGKEPLEGVNVDL